MNMKNSAFFVFLLVIFVPFHLENARGNTLGPDGQDEDFQRTTSSNSSQFDAPPTPRAPLNLDAALIEAMERSPDIQRVRAARSEYGWRHFEAFGAGFLPKISASALHYFDTKYSITGINFGGAFLSFPGFYPINVTSLDVTIPVFDGFASTRKLQSASYEEDASIAELSQAEFQLHEDIRLSFYRTLAAISLQDVAKQNVKTLEDHLKQIEVRKHGGAATNYDVLRVQVQLNEARADLIDAEDSYATARRKLTQLLGLEADDRSLEGVLPIPDAAKVKDLRLKEIPVERADIRALNLRAEAAEKARQAAAGWFIPSVSLAANYTLYDSQIFDKTVQNTGNYLNSYNFGVFVKWNLFDGGVALAREREASYAAVQSEKATQSAKLQVPYDFDYWKRRYLSNTDHYTSKKFDVTRSEESVRLAKEEERAGTRTSTETLDAELDLFRSKQGVVNAQMNAAEAQIRLELALGKEI